MNLQVISCNYQKADLSVRERLAFSSEEKLVRAYAALKEEFPKTESVVISTCNRVELYTAQSDSLTCPTVDDIAQFFSRFHQVPLNEFLDGLWAFSGPEAVRHLFAVTSSLDSMVLGEPQIVNQVKSAYELAKQNEACGPLTHALFQGAIKASSRVRTETKLSEGRVSIASVAVGEFGKAIFDRFSDKTVLVLGAGEMAEETLRYLHEEGVGRLIVLNRSLERGELLAGKWGGTAHPWSQLDQWLGQADVIVSTTGATEPIVTPDRYRAIRKQHGRRQVFILDLGAPRDFAPGVRDVDEDIFLYDIDDLESTCARNRKLREKEIARAEKIIQEETEKFTCRLNHQATGPIIQQLRDEWQLVSQEQLARLFSRLPHLSDKDREQVEITVNQIINKLLHPPLEVLKAEARRETPHGLIDALKHLFNLNGRE